MRTINGTFFVRRVPVVAMALMGACGNGSSENPDGGTVVYGGSDGTTGQLTLTFVANGASGTAPSTIAASAGQSITLPGPGALDYSSYVFAGWQTSADGSGTTYAQGSAFTMGALSTTLYALWAQAFLYTVLQQPNATQPVSALAITPAGQLSLLASYDEPPAQAQDAWSLVADPGGHYLYIPNFCGPEGCSPPDTAVAQYAIGASGALTLLAAPVLDLGTSAGDVGGGLSNVAIHPKMPYLYVVTGNSGICQLQYATATGALSKVGCTAAANETENVVVDPTGAFAWTVTWGTPAVQAYTIDSTGALTANGQPLALYGSTMISATLEEQPQAMHVVSTGTAEYLYISNYDNSWIWQFQVGSGGTLVPVGANGVVETCPSCPSPVNNPSGVSNFGMAPDPSGKYLYVATEVDTSTTAGGQPTAPAQEVIQLSIQGDGSLANPNPVVLIPSSAQSSSLVSGLAVFVSSATSKEYLYATTGTASAGSIFEFEINPQNGTLTPLPNASIEIGSQAMVIVTP